MVLCDKPVFHDERKDVLTDATLVAEVLSPSTEGYDRGGKFALYRGLPGLRQYLLIAQDRLGMDLFTRQADGRWLLDAYTDMDTSIRLESIDCTLQSGEVYDKIDLDAVARVEAASRRGRHSRLQILLATPSQSTSVVRWHQLIRTQPLA